MPATTDLALGCTPAIHAQLGSLADAVVRELDRMGIVGRWRNEPRRADATAEALGP